MADELHVVIREIETEGYLLELVGPELPERGVEVPTTLRAATHRYPGSNVVSTQVMGVEEDDVTIRGWFNDVLATSDRPRAIEQVFTARELLARGRLCRLEWGEDIVRHGRIKSFRPRFHLHSLVEYTLVFQVEASEEESPPLEVRREASVYDAIRAIDKVGDALKVLERGAQALNVIQAGAGVITERL